MHLVLLVFVVKDVAEFNPQGRFDDALEFLRGFCEDLDTICATKQDDVFLLQREFVPIFVHLIVWKVRLLGELVFP